MRLAEGGAGSRGGVQWPDLPIVPHELPKDSAWAMCVHASVCVSSSGGELEGRQEKD